MSKRILVVDDEADVNTAIRVVLRQNGFIVDSYEDPPLLYRTSNLISTIY